MTILQKLEYWSDGVLEKTEIYPQANPNTPSLQLSVTPENLEDLQVKQVR
jgi:hypothetical protein